MIEGEDGAERASSDDIKYNVFIAEIAQQCRFVLMAVGELEQLEGRGRSLYRLLSDRFQELHRRFGFPPSMTSERMEHELITGLIRLQSVGLYERLRRVRFYVDNIVDHAARIERFFGQEGEATSSGVRGFVVDSALMMRRRYGSESADSAIVGST